MTEPNDAAALETAKNQTEAMILLAGKVEKLSASGRRTWKFVLFDIALTIGLAAFAWIAHGASVSAGQAQQATLLTCQANNTARAENRQIWDFLIALSAPPATDTAKQKAAADKQLAVIQGEINRAFAPRNCAAILRGQ